MNTSQASSQALKSKPCVYQKKLIWRNYVREFIFCEAKRNLSRSLKISQAHVKHCHTSTMEPFVKTVYSFSISAKKPHRSLTGCYIKYISSTCLNLTKDTSERCPYLYLYYFYRLRRFLFLWIINFSIIANRFTWDFSNWTSKLLFGIS